MAAPKTNETTEATETSVFTKIINGDIPGRFVWADDVCVAFATIEPQTPGHVLVVPRIARESYIDANEPTVAHLAVVAKRIAAAQVRVFDAVRPGIVVLGLDVPHLHIHVLPLHRAADIAPSSARPALRSSMRRWAACARGCTRTGGGRSCRRGWTRPPSPDLARPVPPAVGARDRGSASGGRSDPRLAPVTRTARRSGANQR